MPFIVAFRWYLNGLRVASLCFATGAILAITEDLSLSMGRVSLSKDVLAILFVGFTLASAALFGNLKRKMHDRAARSKFQLCTSCGYDLGYCDGRVSCPECGRPVDLPAFRAAWKRLLE